MSLQVSENDCVCHAVVPEPMCSSPHQSCLGGGQGGGGRPLPFSIISALVFSEQKGFLVLVPGARLTAPGCAAPPLMAQVLTELHISSLQGFSLSSLLSLLCSGPLLAPSALQVFRRHLPLVLITREVSLGHQLYQE